MKITIYVSMDKKREVTLGRALSAGFKKHGEDVETIASADYTMPKGDTQVAVMIGVKSKRFYEDYRRCAKHTLICDKAYFGRKEYWRMSLDGFQPPYLHTVKRDTKRLETFKLKFQRKREPHSYKDIIYAGSSQKYCDFHGLGDVTAYAEGVCHALNKSTHSRRRVIYRPKPSWAAGHPEAVKMIPNTHYSGPNEFLSDLYGNAHLVATHGSNAAVEAIAAGVPALVFSQKGVCAAYDLAETNMDNSEDPFFPTDDQRLQHFAQLAWCQFTEEEIASGFAWETILPHTLKAIDLSDMGEEDRHIAMYQFMHRMDKMFRGNSLKGHWEAVKGMVYNYAPGNLLDYGSGKGIQYNDDGGLHLRWGGLKPTCYDPGYPPFAKKPEGKFDGVICTDVAEHIPESAVNKFLGDVVGYANKFVFFCIYTGPASKFLPDGNNCHVTQRPKEWWLERIEGVTGGKPAGTYMVTKPLPDGSTGEFPYHVITADNKPDVIVTFRGTEEKE